MTVSRDDGRAGRGGAGTGVPGDHAGATPTGSDVGGVGGRTAVGGGLGSGDRPSGAAGTGIGGGAATGEGLNDIGVASGDLGSDTEHRSDGPQEPQAPPPGPGVSGQRG